jgi:DNA-binding FadR family transcriptional regulator
VSLREALRMLEQESLIETRHGEGSQVRDFTESSGLGVLKHLVKLGLPSPELLRSTLEFRAILGTELTRLAAEKAGPDDIEALEAIIAAEEDEIDNPSAVQRWDFLFFERLAVASRNQLIKFLMNTIREPYLQQGDLFSALIGEPNELLGYHKGILSAIKARNPARAARLAATYLNHGMNRIFKEEG